MAGFAAPSTDGRDGKLLVIVGPSGAGKDTLINWLRSRLEGDEGIVFARRTITRETPDAAEDHEAVSVEDFRALEAAGAFSVTWAAHGLFYGLPAALADDLKAGRIVIANGSRGAIPDIEARFPDVTVVNLTVLPDILAERLARRGRENETAIAARLARSAEVALTCRRRVDVDNSGPVAGAGEAVLGLIEASKS